MSRSLEPCDRCFRPRYQCGGYDDCAEAALDHWRQRALTAEHENESLREQFFDLAAFYDAKARWSIETFGPGDRYAGVVAHIRKELIEIEADPSDLVEWCDVILLAMDGAMRSAGADGAALCHALFQKQEANVARRWPDWRTLKPGEVSEHVKEES